MPLTSAQIVTLATQTAKCPAWTSQAGQLLNSILFELADNYDFDVARQVFNFSFNTNNIPPVSSPLQIPSSSGPYPLPTNWLRADRDNVYYVISGVRYVMIPFSFAEFNACVQQPGLNAYPENYAVDNSPISLQQPPNMYVWPPAGGAYPVTAVYYSQPTDITTPETSSVVPWFPLQVYLLRRLAGELMLISNDDRAAQFLGGSVDEAGQPFGAQAILRSYLKNKDDAQVVKTVTLDRRRFGLNFDKLKNTKTIGW